MLVTIHQPEHIPWLGYFNKIDKADLLVHLDNVQFEKNYFQNRNKILLNGMARYVTVPVSLRNHMSETIAQTKVNYDRDWEKKYLMTIYHNYCRHPYFSQHYKPLCDIIRMKHSRLLDLNCALIDYFIKVLAIDTKIVYASQIIEGYQGKKNLLTICKQLQANHYLSGPSGLDYLDEEEFIQAGITVNYNQFVHPTYSQYHQEQFVSHLSVIDLLFNYSVADAMRIIRSGSV